MQLLSRFPGVRTVGSLRAKKQSCSTRQGLRADTGFGESTTSRGRGLLLLGYFLSLRAL